jgi:hypothetical protein
LYEFLISPIRSTCPTQLILLDSSSSFLGSTVQRRPWPPPQNPAEFLGGFSTIFFFTWLDHPNNIWRSVQVTKLVIM